MIIIVHFKKGNGTCVQLEVQLRLQLIVYFANVMVTAVRPCLRSEQQTTEVSGITWSYENRL